MSGIHRERRPSLAAAGIVLAWASWLAALPDMAENSASLTILLNQPSSLTAQAAWWTAAAKFLMVSAGILYSAVGAAYWLAGRLR